MFINYKNWRKTFFRFPHRCDNVAKSKHILVYVGKLYYTAEQHRALAHIYTHYTLYIYSEVRACWCAFAKFHVFPMYNKLAFKKQASKFFSVSSCFPRWRETFIFFGSMNLYWAVLYDSLFFFQENHSKSTVLFNLRTFRYPFFASSIRRRVKNQTFDNFFLRQLKGNLPWNFNHRCIYTIEITY